MVRSVSVLLAIIQQVDPSLSGSSLAAQGQNRPELVLIEGLIDLRLCSPLVNRWFNRNTVHTLDEFLCKLGVKKADWQTT